VSMMIDGLYGMAVQHGDYASQVFLQWFVTEQVEEERTAAEIVQTLKTLGGEPALARGLGGVVLSSESRLSSSRSKSAGSWKSL